MLTLDARVKSNTVAILILLYTLLWPQQLLTIDLLGKKEAFPKDLIYVF